VIEPPDQPEHDRHEGHEADDCEEITHAKNTETEDVNKT
jgi:hypothetical protein